ncbi:hypothetical protein OUZ56_002989 [Daphnia magna]|uniref:Uncharacterized protein n=1 Tax=Daphnia magna TaxID=35525 RepID=A0ABR0A7V2_9CRUS|nr:hypothetical protein OUZ56_002989 [Daphnia magna]
MNKLIFQLTTVVLDIKLYSSDYAFIIRSQFLLTKLATPDGHSFRLGQTCQVIRVSRVDVGQTRAAEEPTMHILYIVSKHFRYSTGHPTRRVEDKK